MSSEAKLTPIRGNFKYYFADFVRKWGEGGTPQICNSFFVEFFSVKEGRYPPYGQNPQSSIWNRSLLIPESANFGTVALYIGRQMKFKSDYFQILVCNLTNGLEKHE